MKATISFAYQSVGICTKEAFSIEFQTLLSMFRTSNEFTFNEIRVKIEFRYVRNRPKLDEFRNCAHLAKIHFHIRGILIISDVTNIILQQKPHRIVVYFDLAVAPYPNYLFKSINLHEFRTAEKPKPASNKFQCRTAT